MGLGSLLQELAIRLVGSIQSDVSLSNWLFPLSKYVIRGQGYRLTCTYVGQLNVKSACFGNEWLDGVGLHVVVVPI